MWSDNESSLDLLGFDTHADVIAAVVNTHQLLPVTIGVFGDWGSGKSSLMKMLANRLGAQDDILVLSFNGWQFEGYDDAKAALMGTIIDTLRKDRRVLEKAADLAKSLAKRVDWFRLMGLAAKKVVTLSLGVATGVPLEIGSIFGTLTDLPKLKEMAEGVDPEKAKEFLREQQEDVRTSIREFREDFADLIRRTNYKAVVILVDDLDRCLPPTIIETLEAIRLFMFVPNTAFIIGADERIIRNAVTSKFPSAPDLQFDVGRDYLEKVIQIPVRLPSLGTDEIETFMNLLFAQLHLGQSDLDSLVKATQERRSTGTLGPTCTYSFVKETISSLPSDLDGDLAMSSILAPVLGLGLRGNPRQIKRFLNSLLLRIRLAESRKVTLKKQVLAKLMLLEYFQLVRFRQLSEWQKEQAGLPRQITELESAAKRAVAEGLPQEMETWVTDSWTKDWLIQEPSLAGVDLGPYFHFARERLTDTGSATRRLSPRAQEVLTKLLGSGDAIKKLGAKESLELAQGDAVGVFDQLMERIRKAEDNKGLMLATLELVTVRKDLLSQLLTALGEMPPGNVPPLVPPRLKLIAKGTASQSATTKLLEVWAETTTDVGKAAQIVLKRRT